MARGGPAPELTEVFSDLVVIEPRPGPPGDAPLASNFIEGFDDFRKNVSVFVGDTFRTFVPGASTADGMDGQDETFASTPDTLESFEVSEVPPRNAAIKKHAQILVKNTLGQELGPKILLKCIDAVGEKKCVQDLWVEWNHSWEFVMRELKRLFKRDVVFEYEVAGRVIRVHDDATFDRAMALAEASGNRLFVVIQEAAWKIAQDEEEEPDEPDPEEEVGPGLDFKLLLTADLCYATYMRRTWQTIFSCKSIHSEPL